MVQDRVSDGFRVAELLASEVDGRHRGPLGPLAVANADRSIDGTPSGERAYEIHFLAGDRDPRREPTPEEVGTLVAEVLVHEQGASLAVVAGADVAADTAEEAGLTVTRAEDASVETASDGVVIELEYGAQVKRAADALGAASTAVQEDAA